MAAQVKLLDQTENRLYAAQRQVEAQLRQIRTLNQFALTAPQTYSEVDIFAQAIDLLWSLLPARAAAGLLWQGGAERWF